ncbi:hypothetical protein CYMTET_12436 [Cymbomonas tetramitiformis]|uniref:Uncharacterized protein n=1 Tax=Cymbomonas tetramitiformis TaxID=36881 RepID=A0AAE0LBU8_9CHLO|nr:hypothetical protein CYMTET_12436 [Cymbomonas tetramitiformis]
MVLSAKPAQRLRRLQFQCGLRKKSCLWGKDFRQPVAILITGYAHCQKDLQTIGILTLEAMQVSHSLPWSLTPHG